MTSYIGRTVELKAIDNALARAAHRVGGNGAMVISGEAGVGKSRLLWEARRRATEQGFAVLQGYCEEPDAAAAYSGIASLLRRYLAQEEGRRAKDALAPLLADALLLKGHSRSSDWHAAQRQQQEGQMAAKVLEWLANVGGEGPLLVTLEDIHWCDDASLACLAAALQAPEPRLLLLMVSVRMPHPDPQMEGVAEKWFLENGAEHLRLQPLDRGQVGLVMRSLSPQRQAPPFYFVKHVHEVTGGNPFFVEELCLSSQATDVVSNETDLLALQPRPLATIPRSIRRVIRQRLQAVSAEAQMIADLCAVHGRVFDLTLLQLLTGFSDERLRERCDELCAAHLAIAGDQGDYFFRHGLVREALYDRLLVRERRRLHERLILGLERLYDKATGGQLATLSYHSYMAGSWRRALRYCRRAAEDALALGAPRVAVLQLTRAIEAGERVAEATTWQLHCLRAQALEQCGAYDGALTDYATALDSARLMGDGEAEARVWEALVTLLPALRRRYSDSHYNLLVAQAGLQQEDVGSRT